MATRADRNRHASAATISDADLRLWQEVTRTAKPLPVKRSASSRTVRASGGMETAPAPASLTAMPAVDRDLVPAKRPPPPPARAKGPGELRHGDSAGIDRRTHDRFKRGRMAIEGRLDLHGMTRERAHQALSTFLHRAYDRGARCVLVVTGKGSGREGGGVLRRDVPLWLNQSGLRALVLSFTHAQIRDGGQGALYVLLKRRR